MSLMWLHKFYHVVQVQAAVRRPGQYRLVVTTMNRHVRVNKLMTVKQPLTGQTLHVIQRQRRQRQPLPRRQLK